VLFCPWALLPPILLRRPHEAAERDATKKELLSSEPAIGVFAVANELDHNALLLFGQAVNNTVVARDSQPEPPERWRGRLPVTSCAHRW
jgi:hypothetical protein